MAAVDRPAMGAVLPRATASACGLGPDAGNTCIPLPHRCSLKAAVWLQLWTRCSLGVQTGGQISAVGPDFLQRRPKRSVTAYLAGMLSRERRAQLSEPALVGGVLPGGFWL